jgi:CHAD domain-containing protein
MVSARVRYRSRRAHSIAVRPWLEHLVAHVPIARAGTDPEGVHQMRVAIARIRVWLELGGWRVLHDDLRRLRAAAAGVRDLDVQLARDIPAAYAAELRAERTVAHQSLLAALDDPEFQSLVSALENMPPVRRRQARKRLARFIHRAVARGRELPRNDYARLHALRRSVRRVRFALEWLGEPAGELVKLQEALGEFGDVWVAFRRASRGRKSSQVREHRPALKRELRIAARTARRAWTRGRSALERLA